MAEDILQNVEDGELWLPSDVIRAVGVCPHHHHHHSGRLAAMDDLAQKQDLAQKLASLDLLDRRREFQSAKPFKDPTFFPEFQLQGHGRLANRGYKAPVRRRVAADEWTGAYFPVPKPIHKFYPPLPVDSNGERIRMGTSRVLQRQRQHQGHVVNRFIPARSACSGRESGGTGVFLPRVYRVDSRKKPSNFQGISLFEQSMWSPALDKQGEMDLPRDWTY